MTIEEQRQSEFQFAAGLFWISFFLFSTGPVVWRSLFQVTLGLYGAANLYLAIQTYRLIRTKFSPLLSSVLSVVVCIPGVNLLAVIAIPLFLSLPSSNREQ